MKRRSETALCYKLLAYDFLFVITANKNCIYVIHN